ncbi:MAG: hypothetical protein GF329_17710 [Candidatus Lokiarchaeota archaeon]|nr:hypothetical protein [Candidatus Lokiarchaeota archaeon]
MPYSLVIVDWDKIKGPNVIYRYPPAEPHYNDDIPMQIFMMHTAKEPPEEQITLNLSGIDVLSQFIQFKQEGSMRRIILLLLLKPEEKAIDFKRKLIKFKEKVIGKLDSEDLQKFVANYYKENFAAGIKTFSVEGMKKKLIDQAQNLLEKGQTQKARNLIEKSERIPRTIFNLIKKAEKAYENEEYIDASKFYEDIVALLTEVQEDEMAANYAQKAMQVKKIPKLLEEQKDLSKKLHKHTKKIEFEQIIELLTDLAKVSSELGHAEKSNGYSDQALALKQFMESDPDREEQEKDEEEDVVLVVDEDES